MSLARALVALVVVVLFALGLDLLRVGHAWSGGIAVVAAMVVLLAARSGS